MTKVVAILCADMHLSEKPPIARSAEPDWYAAMLRPIRELRDLSEEHKASVVCAGDIFDRWRCNPELVNFALRELPKLYAVPGQHDMPYHNYDDLQKSAYWTLVEAGKIVNMVPEEKNGPPAGYTFDEVDGGFVVMCPFPWGFDPASVSLPEEEEDGIMMAVVHQFCWLKSRKIPVEDSRNSASMVKRLLNGYDVVLFGDNHDGFLLGAGGGPVIFNAGTFMRRASDERDYVPMVGLLCVDGSVKQHFLDASEDKFLNDVVSREAEETMLHLEGFLEGLRGLGESGLDFQKAIEQALDDCSATREIRRVVLDAMVGEPF